MTEDGGKVEKEPLPTVAQLIAINGSIDGDEGRVRSE